MIKNLKYIGYLTFLAGLLSACAGFEPTKLDTRKDVPVYKNNGKGPKEVGESVLFDFRGSLGQWWSDSKFSVAKIGSVMRIKASEVGPSYEALGTDIDEMSFTNHPFLKVKMRVEEGTTDFPTLRIDLKDRTSKQTNGSPASVVIDSAGYKIYYFDFYKKWKQTFPDNADVNSDAISGIQCFINPGGKPWTGTLYIDEISATANPDGSGVLPSAYVLDDFSGGTDLWWPCNAEKVSIGKLGADKLKVTIKDGQWDCFGKVFAEVDVTNTPIIRVRARGISTTGATKTNIMARFIDANDNATDLIDGQNMRDFEVGGSGYNDYYSVFAEDLYSSTGDFDPTRVNRIIVFINMNQEANFEGDIILDQVAFVKELPAKVKDQLQNPWGSPPSADASWTVGQAPAVLEDFSSIANWKTTSSPLSLSQGSGTLKIEANTKSSDWAYITGDIKGSNLFDYYLVKVKAKATGNVSPVLRFTFIDDEGLETNARPQEIKISNDGKLDDYYLKVLNSRHQLLPEMKVVNMKNIKKVKVTVNPGLSSYKGVIEIDELSFLNVDDVPKEATNAVKDR